MKRFTSVVLCGARARRYNGVARTPWSNGCHAAILVRAGRRYVGRDRGRRAAWARDADRPRVSTEVLPFVTYLTIRTSGP